MVLRNLTKSYRMRASPPVCITGIETRTDRDAPRWDSAEMAALHRCVAVGCATVDFSCSTIPPNDRTAPEQPQRLGSARRKRAVSNGLGWNVASERLSS